MRGDVLIWYLLELASASHSKNFVFHWNLRGQSRWPETTAQLRQKEAERMTVTNNDNIYEVHILCQALCYALHFHFNYNHNNIVDIAISPFTD